jgi:hypothetical protein
MFLKTVMLTMTGSSALLAGCAVNEGPQQPMPPIVVPPGATLLAYGWSQPPLFYPTRASETLYIYDETTEQVVSVTRTWEVAPDEPVPAIDLSRLGVSLDPDHHYRVYGVSADASQAPGPPPPPPPPRAPATRP